jgi:hypothetical protein
VNRARQVLQTPTPATRAFSMRSFSTPSFKTPSFAILALSLLAFSVLAFSAAGPAAAAVAPEGGQAAYDLPLKALDLESYHSASIDADRSQVENALARKYGGTWTVYSWNPQSRTASEMYGSGVDLTGALTSSDDVKSQAERVIRDNPTAFKADLAGLKFKEVTSAPQVTDSPDGIRRVGKWAAHYQQVYHGIDVVGGNVHMTFTDTGRLFAMGSTYYQDISVDWTPTLSADRAKEIARNSLPFNAATDSVETAVNLLILPVPLTETQVEHHLVWEARVYTAEPLGLWITDVDAHSGQILQRTNDADFVLFFGSEVGQVERTAFCDGSHQEAFPYVHVAIFGVGDTYADANGNWVYPSGGFGAVTLYSRLYSPYVDVQNMQGSYAGQFATIFPDVPYQVNFTNANSRADERDVYITVQDLHNFFETFAPGFGFTNQMVTAQVNINNSCNAYYLGNAIHFYQAGGGCANTGQMMDIVAHEYGHGVQEAILGGQGNEGLGEGNGDVLAFLTSMNSVIGRGWYNCAGGGIRDCNNTLKYPGDVVGQEIHNAGRVIAGFHWDAMQDQIADYGSWGRYSTAWDWHWGRVLQHPMTQPAQVLATFIANDDDGNLSNGTPQFSSYCMAATRHGFTCPSVTLPLASTGCDTYYQSPQGFSMNQQNNYWTVAGVSPSPGDDKDMYVYTAGYGTLLASSTGTVGTDFVVGDFNHTPVGVYQPYVTYGGATTPYVTEWDSGPDAITLGTDIFGSVGGGGGICGLVKAWDVFLTAGQTYAFGLLNAGGSADMRMSLFRNPASAPYWAGRSASVLELQAGSSSLYTAPASDWYGVVVFNNSPGSPTGYYYLRVQDAPVAMSSAACQTWNTSPRMFGFYQGFAYWTGVAVNPGTLDDKDIAVYADPGGAGTLLASSTGTVGTDFVVGDFNHNAAGTYYSRVSYGAVNASYVTEWDSGQDVVYVGTDVTGSVGGGSGGCGLIQVSDIYLNAGQQVRFLLLTGGSADIRMSLFRNPSDSPYWAGRGWSEFEVGNAEGHTYTAPASDWYGVVVFNNSPGAPAGSYTLRVRDLPAAMTDATCLTSSPVPQLYSITQSIPYWTAVAINPSGADDKDVWVYDNPDGLASPLAYSAGTVGTDYVIGDFNHNPYGTYYPMATYGASPANYVVDWDGGMDIFPIGPQYAGSVGGGDGTCGLVKVWDVWLEAGNTYHVVLTSAGAADVRVALFRNPASAPYWAGRYNAEFEAQPGGTPYDYTAPASDYYGLVVFNASPDSPPGTYTLRFTNPAGVGEEEVVLGKPGITFQNPYRSGSPMMLRAAADGTVARVDVYNVQGRRVRTLFDESVGKAGRQLTWDGRTDEGVKLASGIYFVNVQIGSTSMKKTLVMLK